MTITEELKAEVKRINSDLATLQPHIIKAFVDRDMATADELTAAWKVLNDDLTAAKEALRHA